jgi:hypothetical protein
MQTTYIYRIDAAIQPKKRAKWIQVSIDYGEEGTTEINLEEAMQIARQMQAELEEEYPDWTKGEYAPVYSTYYSKGE